jgi:hypothetical protein
MVFLELFAGAELETNRPAIKTRLKNPEVALLDFTSFPLCGSG